MNKEELQKILELHKLWLRGDLKGKSANLRGANLYGANLQDADLRGANLRDANLRDANLRGANGVLNPTITQTWRDSFKDAIHFYSVFRR
jgi:uncharacterized protein YjbI with pentapeptide repeats